MPTTEILPSSCHVFLLLAALTVGLVSGLTIQNDDPRIHYHGRWDDSPGTWWRVSTVRFYTFASTNSRRAGSGFKLHVQNAITMKIQLGSLTTSPFAAVGSSVDYEPFFTVNASAGWNDIPPPAAPGFKRSGKSVIRLNVEGCQRDNILLWVSTKRVGEKLQAEHTINAQPGATLTDIPSYGNVRGVSFQFFKAEDTGYVWTSDHNYTTPWDFRSVNQKIR